MRSARLLGLFALPFVTACTLAPFPLTPCTSERSTPGCERAVRTESPVDGATDDGVVRFFAIGDAGVSDPTDATKLGATAEYVARLTDSVCAARGGCDFGVFLGDNVYETGVSGPAARAYLEGFAERYSAGWTRPLYFVLGNHDYHPVFPTQARAEEELRLIESIGTKHAGLVRGSAHFFQFRAGPVELFAWDTNHLVHACEAAPGGTPDCVAGRDDALRALRASTSPFRVWLGHHPYWSNGAHGDAGDFLDEVSLWRGAALQQLMREHVIGVADLALSGHDHNLQAFAHRGTALVVSGAGAKSTDLRPRGLRDPALFEKDAVLGMALIEATADKLTVELYGGDTTMRGCDLVPSSRVAPIPRFRMSRTRGSAWAVEPTSAE